MKETSKQDFTNHLIQDLEALDKLIKDRKFETGITRIGAEQEFCLIDYSLRPAMIAMEMLEKLNDDHFTTELAKFNLEANLNPLVFKDNCLSHLENDLIRILIKANTVAHSLGSKIILTGILPTIRSSDIVMDNMTPNPRYKALNDAILSHRSSKFKFNITGIDDLVTKHDTVLFESCNTSFQVHFQVDPDQVPSHLNWARAIAGPVLASAANSPIFLGKRLWRETRIALFHQSTDIRKSMSTLRNERPRVTFGTGWETKSAVEIFQDLVGRYQILMPVPIQENSLEMVNNGKVPKLQALSTHNSTVYKWNRLCYGITEGKPHFRIENRYLPSGPSIVDEVANAAFWTGLMAGVSPELADIHKHMDFDQAKNNFVTAAKVGLQAQFTWIDGELIPAQRLILDELLPLSRAGLIKAGLDMADIDKYLNVIEQRVASTLTGASWMLQSFDRLKEKSTLDEAMVTLTEGIYQRQKAGTPAHQWKPLVYEEGGGWHNRFHTVEQVMVKDLITIHEDDLVDLGRNIMRWSNIHHLPVENKQGELVGLVTSDKLLAILGDRGKEIKTLTIGEIMVRDVLQIDPQTPTIEAYNIMKNNEIGCLPVVENSKLVGIITIQDYVKLIGFFFDELEKNSSG